MMLNQLLLDDLWGGEKSICCFVFFGQCFWVLDEKYNFSLDAEKDYRAYLNKGHITQEQYELACKEFRGGVLKLAADNFSQYIGDEKRHLLTRDNLAELFCWGGLGDNTQYDRLEAHYLTGIELDLDDVRFVNALASRLPKFYVNFDRKIYMHMDFGRFHEELAYSDWMAKCADFGFLIPDKEKYWVLGGKDYWKFKFFQSF